MKIRAYITHKKSEEFSDCQDRFSINCDTKSIAVADGMSQSVFQKYWAQILVESYTSRNDFFPNLEAIRELTPQWKEKVIMVIENLKKSGCQSAWRSERSIQSGESAGATFLGIRFDGTKWVCHVLGDSSLIRIIDKKVVEIFTSEKVVKFDNYPDFYDSDPSKRGKGELCEKEGELTDNAALLLVSDPFSDYLLINKGSEREEILINELLSVQNHTEFEQLVESWRNRGMHNDDSTLVIVEPDGSDDFHIDSVDDIDKLSVGEYNMVLGSNMEEPQAETAADNEVESKILQLLKGSIKEILNDFKCFNHRDNRTIRLGKKSANLNLNSESYFF